jgi:hypothetical protein
MFKIQKYRRPRWAGYVASVRRQKQTFVGKHFQKMVTREIKKEMMGEYFDNT